MFSKFTHEDTKECISMHPLVSHRSTDLKMLYVQIF